MAKKKTAPKRIVSPAAEDRFIEIQPVEEVEVEESKDVTIDELHKAVRDCIDAFYAYGKVSKRPIRYVRQAQRLQALFTRRVI